MVTLISFCYRKDITTDNRLMDWKSPNEHISLYSYLVIKGIRWVFFGLAIILLPIFSGWIIFRDLSASSLSHEQFNLAIATCVLSVLFLSLSLYFFIKSGNEVWAQQGLPENEFIDRQVVYSLILITVWTMSLILSVLRYSSLSESGELNLYWLWMPSVFILGGMAGSATLQATQILQNLFPLRLIFSKHVVSKVNQKYDHNSVGKFQRWFLKLIGIPDNRELKDDSKLIRKSRGVDYTSKIWASPEFRSIFWTLQGILVYGLLGSTALSLIALPNYFSIPSGSEPAATISLSVALLSALWAYLTSSGKNLKIGEWISRIFKLPEELYQILLAILVVALNLSVFYLIESMLMDRLLTSLSFLQMAAIILPVVILFAVTGYFVNANYLSAHYFYRDRLGEAYFQTSVSDYQSGKIRVVRDDRNRPMSRTLKPQCSAPYHIVMTSLNMSGSWHLEYKDRKSQPFIFTRDYCGSDITGYVKTVNYRNDNTKYSQAIALSGAAVSSGIGHLTFFAQAFLVTLFNLRLGAWLTNPKLYAHAKDANKAKNAEESNFWGYYLWNEARGQMSEREKLVNITDGAHTGDNIGLYPLFQRRCKYIIAGDAGEDPRGTFNELFSVLRQVELDFGIKVNINLDGVGPDEYDEDKKIAAKSKRHFAVGKIHYPATTTEDPIDGWLIYFHPSVTEGDPAAILKYWERHKSSFPHPTTADQFFDDEQFEITRMLGEWTVQSAIMEAAQKFKADKFIKALVKIKGQDVSFEVPAKSKTDIDKTKQALLNGLPDLLEQYYSHQGQQA